MAEEDYSNNPLYNREMLKSLMGTPIFTEAPSQKAEPSIAGAVTAAEEPSTPLPPRRPPELEQLSKDEAQAKEAYEKMKRPSPSVPSEALAAASGYGETFAPEVFPSLVAAGAKGLGKLGISGYERFAEQPFAETRKEVTELGRRAREESPKAGIAGTAAGLGAGMATLPVVAPGASPAVSGALTGGTYGFISGAAEQNKWSDALTHGLIGLGLGGTLAPIAEHTASGLTRLLFGGKPVVDPHGNLTEEAIGIAKEAGLTDSQIDKISPYLIQTFEQRGLTKEAAREAPFREFGIEPKKGMVSDDVEQLTHEIKHGSYEQQAKEAQQAAEEFAGAKTPSVRDAIDAAIERGQEKASQLKSQYESAYKAARDVPGKFSRAAITDVGTRLMQNLAVDPNAQHLYNNPIVQDAAKYLDKAIGKSIEGPGGVKVLWQNFNAVEGARKGLNDFFAQAKTATEKAGIRRLIEDFDQHVEDQIRNGAFSGGTGVAQDWAHARRLFSEYQRKYGVKKTGEDAGKIMKDIMEQNRSSDDVARMMFNFAGSGDVTAKAGAMKVYNQLRRALGPNSPELEEIKRSFVQQLMTPVLREGEKATPGHFADTAKQIDTFLRGNTASFAKSVLNPKEIETLERFADVMRVAARKPEHLTPEVASSFTQAASFAAPIIVDAYTGLLNFLPAPLRAAAVLGSGAYARKQALKGSEEMARAAADLPPRNLPRTYRYPEVRPLIPLTEEAREREGRATGGSVKRGMTADMLISAAERAKKQNQETTKKILGAPDKHVVKALEVANRGI